MFNFHVFCRQVLLFYCPFTFSSKVLCMFVFMQAFFPAIGLFISKVYLHLLLYFILVSISLYCIADHFLLLTI